MTLNERQTLRQLVRTRRFWATIVDGGLALAVKYNAFPLHGVWHNVVFTIAFAGVIAGAIANGLWQPSREQWGHEQKLRESARRIAEGLPPLEGYEHMIEPPPPFPPALPPAEDGAPLEQLPPSKSGRGRRSRP